MHLLSAVGLLSGLTALALALTPADNSTDPAGNPIIHPGLDEIMPGGSIYTIEWTPTTNGSISLLLLRGPSSDATSILTIADSIPNNGSYAWEVPETLEPDTTGYGIELVVEGSGQYQYSAQCGVSEAASFSNGTTVTSTTESAGSAAATTSVFSFDSTTAGAGSGSSSAAAAATGTGNFSISVLSPTKSMTVPASLRSSSTSATTTTGHSSASIAQITPSLASASSAANHAKAVPAFAAGLLDSWRNMGAAAVLLTTWCGAVGLAGAMAL